MLNDIPFHDLVGARTDIHLIDWIPGIVDSGIGGAIIEMDSDGNPECAFCVLGENDAQPWCRRFSGANAMQAGVCDNFEPIGEMGTGCKSYERGDEPHVLYQDATGGYATGFARRSYEVAKSAGSWAQAIRQATGAARRAGNDAAALDITDGSIDLVTSSMVMSQFEHEPYDYFSRQVASRVGLPSERDKRHLDGPVDTLREALATRQIEGHLDEAARIMAPDGRLFVAFELFHADPKDGGWFLVRHMHKAMELLDERFDFDFELLPAGGSVIEVQLRGGASLVHMFVLRHKHV